MSVVNVLICDDHQLFCTSVAEVLQKNNLQVTTCFSFSACSELLKENSYDIFICDLNIDGADGFELIASMKTYLKNTRIIILSAYYEPFLIDKARKIGVHSFLKKDISLSQLMEVILSEDSFFEDKLQLKDENYFLDNDKKVVSTFKLSKQERQVVKLILEGKTSQAIADALFISKNTVDTHRSNINRKLEISNVASLLQFASLYNIV